MLEFIRTKAQSFGVKVAFGVIILVFVFWGVGNFNDRDYSNVVAVVNGEPIVASQFELAYRDAEQALLQQNPGLTRKDLEQQHLGRQVLRDLITQTLIQQEADRAGIVVTPLELREAAGKIKIFQDSNGRFDPEAYKSVLEARRMTPAQFERDLTRDMLRDKMFGLVTAAAWVDPAEARHRYDFLREKRAVDYLFLPAADREDGMKASEGEIAKWYEEHSKDFRVPPLANISYILVSPAMLVKPESLDKEQVRKWYEANPARFQDAEGHTLPFEKAEAEAREGLAADLGAERISETLDTLIEDNILGKPLAESAARFGLAAAETGLQDAAGVAARLGIGAEAAQTLLGLDPGAPLDTALEAGDNFIVARVLENRPESLKPLGDVREQIAKGIIQKKALAETMKNATEKLEAIDKNPSAAAARKGAAVERGGAISGFAPDAALAEAIFQAPVGSWLPSAYAVTSEKDGPGAMLVRVGGVEQPADEEWKAIGGFMENALKRERAAEIFGIFMQNLGARAKVEVTNSSIVDRIDGAAQ